MDLKEKYWETLHKYEVNDIKMSAGNMSINVDTKFQTIAWKGNTVEEKRKQCIRKMSNSPKCVTKIKDSYGSWDCIY